MFCYQTSRTNWGKTDLTNLFHGLSSITSGLKHTNWNFWALLDSWLCQTQPPPSAPCSAWPQTDSRSHRKASRRCYLHQYIRRQKSVSESKFGNIASNWCKISLCTWAVICSRQTNRRNTCKWDSYLWIDPSRHILSVNVEQPECVPMLTNKERPGANTWRSLQVEQVEVMLLYCHVNHLNTEKKSNALQGLIYPH